MRLGILFVLKKVTDTTKVIYLTDGVLFRLLAQPENLKDVGTIIFDEFHERSLFMDASLCLIKHLKGSSIISPRIIVTSATIDIQNLNKYLGSREELELISKSYDGDYIQGTKSKSSFGKPNMGFTSPSFE